MRNRSDTFKLKWHDSCLGNGKKINILASGTREGTTTRSDARKLILLCDCHCSSYRTNSHKVWSRSFWPLKTVLRYL